MKLVTKNKEHSLTYEDCVVYYRELSTGEKDKIRWNSYKKGETDLALFFRLALEIGVLRWEGFVDESDKELTYNPSLLEYIPDDLRQSLINGILGTKLGETEANPTNPSETT